jgi:uroporphyrinogen decarboxylase
VTTASGCITDIGSEGLQLESALPLAFWWHQPGFDRSAESLADACVAAQNRYRFDLVKISPAGTYQAADFGAIEAWCGNRRGYGLVAHHPVRCAADWQRIALTPAPGPAMQRAVSAAAIVRAAVDPAVPVLQTVFSPVAQAAQLVGETRLAAALREDRETLRRALQRLTAGTLELIARLRAAGADGVFYAIQQMRGSFFGADEYRELYMQHDRPCLEALTQMPLNLVHLHGRGIHLPYTALPANCWLHWELAPDNPGIAEVLCHSEAPLALGLTPPALLEHWRAGSIGSHIASLQSALGARRGMLTPGCTLPLDLPAAAVGAWRHASLRADGGAPRLSAPRRGPATPPDRIPEAALLERIQDTWTQIIGEAGPPAPRDLLAVFLQAEQILGDRLPLSLLAGPLVRERFISGIAAAAKQPLSADAIVGRPLLWIAPPPVLEPLRLSGLVRALEEFARVRVLEYETGHWMLRRDEAVAAFTSALAGQVQNSGGGNAPLLLGLDQGCAVAMHLAAALTQAGQAPRRLVLMRAGLPPPAVAAPRGGLRAIRWTAWRWLAHRSWRVDHPEVPSKFAALAGRFYGPPAQAKLLDSARRERMLEWLSGLDPPADGLTPVRTGLGWTGGAAQRDSADCVVPGDAAFLPPHIGSTSTALQAILLADPPKLDAGAPHEHISRNSI